jgi:hypothetical protein
MKLRYLGFLSPFTALVSTWISAYLWHIYVPDNWKDQWYVIPLQVTYTCSVICIAGSAVLGISWACGLFEKQP